MCYKTLWGFKVSNTLLFLACVSQLVLEVILVFFFSYIAYITETFKACMFLSETYAQLGFTALL